MSIVTETVNNFPTILSYFFPGFLALGIFSLLTSVQVSGDRNIPLILLISFSIKSIVDALNPYIGCKGLSFEWFYVTYLSVGFLLGVFLSFIYKNRRFSSILVKFFNKTPYPNIWDDIFNVKTGTILMVYFDVAGSYRIQGQLYHYENRGSDSWFELINYRTYVNKELVYTSCSDNQNDSIVLQPSKVAYVQVITPKNID